MAKNAVLLGVGLLACLQRVSSYNTDTCCKLAASENAFNNHTTARPGDVDYQCGQVYSTHLPPAAPLYVDYSYCSSRCRGMQLSKASAPSEWAAPLVQFILPSVIFSMTIPRRKKIEFDYMFDFKWPQTLTRHGWLNSTIQLSMSLLCSLVILIPVTIDSLLWIAGIVVGAGNMLVSGLLEAHLDYRIVRYVRSMGDANDEGTLRIKRELLVTIACGNLSLPARENMERSPLKTIERSLTVAKSEADGYTKSASRLLNLLGAQSSFGGAVGSPVLFYLGAFVYTILDLRNNPSSQDAAISLGFGIEWMIIVHVAIVSGCLLAANNPSTSSGIVGSCHEALKRHPREAPTIHALIRTRSSQIFAPRRKKKSFNKQFLGWSSTYDAEFQPVSLWSRGTNKMRWIRKSVAWRDDPEFRKLMEITTGDWILKVFVPALALIVVPPVVGGMVAYSTPPKGIACRSLSFVIYACCQVTSTILALVRCAVEDDDTHPKRQKLFTGWRFVALSSLSWFGSFMSAIGGTTMQIVGVYRNCICYAGANNWYNINKINPPINLASDTKDAREASFNWILMGSVATAFMAFNCYVGWWYQRLIRHRFTDAVIEMYNLGSDNGPPSDENNRQRASSDNQNAVTDHLLARDDEGSRIDEWVQEAEEELDALNPTRLGGRRGSQVRDMSRGSKGSTKSSQVPLIKVSSDGDGEDIAMVSLGDNQIRGKPVPRKPRPRAYS